MTLFLVRHGRPLVDPAVPAARWELDPGGYDEVWALRESARLLGRALWFSSPEPKALATAELLHDGEVGVVDALGEHRRESAEWLDGAAFDEAVRRAFAVPDADAVPGWEPLAVCTTRVVGAVEAILAQAAGEDVVLVGHATAWTTLAAALSGSEPDLERWRALAMPDLIVVEPLPSIR